MSVLAIACAAIATSLLLPAGATPSFRSRFHRSLRGLVPLGSIAAVLVLRGHLLALVLIAGAAGLGALSLARRSRARRSADETRLRVVEACEAVASELRSGQPPLTALVRGAEVWSGLDGAVAAARLDADVPDALRRAAATPGATALAEAASAWQVSHRVGAGLADALDRVAQAARDELATHRVVAAELASAQATARTVAVLPVVMLLLTAGGGADPWRFLLQTTPGLCCLAAGLFLAYAGMWWIDRIVVAVQAGAS